MNLGEFRDGFPVFEHQVYLSICDKMILHDEVRAGVEKFLAKLSISSASRVEHERYVDACRAKFARLMNVKQREVAIGRNVSDGINSVIWSFDLGVGDNVVICLDLEHPNNVYPWLRARRLGVELRIISHDNGRLNHDAMIAAMDDRTKLITCASVSFAPGYRANLERIGRAARRKDVFFLVDGVQSAGILEHDLNAQYVDGFSTSTSKGLLGLYGFGYLFVSERWIDRLMPAYLSRPAIALDNDDASALGDLDYEIKDSAARFEVGSYNLAGAYASDTALNLLLGLGLGSVEARACELARALRQGLVELGIPNVATGPADMMSNIVVAGELDAGGHGYSATPWVTRLSQALTEADVAHSVRRGQLRFGTHAYNNNNDILRALNVIESEWATL